MASLAESSLGSIPIPQIETLRQHMLGANPVAPGHGAAETHAEQCPARDVLLDLSAHVEVPASGTSTVLQTQDATRTPDLSPLRIRPPNLVPSASAPAQEMEGMLDLTPSQNAFRLLTKAASFHAYPDGDTQPMESQVYRDFHESMIQVPMGTIPRGTHEAADQSANSYGVLAASRTLRTCEEGDTGYIDLERAFQPASPSSNGGFDELLASPQTQGQTTVNAQKQSGPAMPETPAFAGRKHDRHAEPPTSATTTTRKTPAYSQLFGMVAGGSVLSATQLFNQTQAPSSPLPDQLRSDPVVTRPSPNIIGRPVISSPPDAFSSPILTLAAQDSSAADPRGTYMSMRESQERRAARFRQELGRQVKGDEDLWLDESINGSTRPHWQRRRMRRVLSDHDVQGAARAGTRVRLSSRPSSANNMPSTVSIMETPATIQRGERLEFDDRFLEQDSDEDLAGTEGDDDEAGNEETNDNDEYDELAQVLRSQVNEDDVAEYAGPSHQDQAVQAEDGPYNRTTELDPAGRLDEMDRPSTQQSAIADSQPGTQQKQKYKPISHGEHHSSSASFIPGSQYTGRTSEDQARLAASQYTRSVQRVIPDKLCSSPPLPMDTGLVERCSNVSSALAPHVEQPANPLPSAGHIAGIDLEVPESDLPELPASRISTSISHGGSHSLPFFSTAQTHTSNHITSQNRPDEDIDTPFKTFASQYSRISEFSPRKAAGVRHFSEFTSATPPDGTGQTQVDVEAVMNDIITAEDREYMAIIGETPEPNHHKRRKLTHQSSADEALHWDAEELPQNKLKSNNGGIHVDTDQEQHDTGRRHRQPGAPDIPCAGQSNEDATDPPNRAAYSSPDSTPKSVRMRELAGAQAASQLLSDRASEPLKKSKAKLRSKTVRNSESSTPILPNCHSTDHVAQQVSNVRDSNGREQPGEAEPRDNPVDSVPNDAQGKIETTSCCLPQTANLDAEPGISHPERTFALFKGRYNQFFPATWLDFSRDKPTHRMQFDDKTVTDIEPQHLCALDLRIGDAVKVDRANMRKETWIVVGFGAVTASGTLAHDVDIRGRSRILVQAKSARNSTGGDNTVTTLSEGVEVHEIPVTNVYITQTMWKRFSDRSFEPPQRTVVTAIRAETPSHRPQTPSTSTPGSRTRRSVQPNAQASHARSMHLRDGPLAPPLPVATGGIFKGMVLAVSCSPADAEHNRTDMAGLIRKNGGLVLDNSFLDLFDVPESDDKKADHQAKSVSGNADGDALMLRIKHEFADLGFVALVSDQHHRKAKYIQALALGLPTLSARWITDCLDVARNPSLMTLKPTPLGWGKYLLPAGESSYLHGAVRSRTLIPEDTTWAKFSATISARPRLLKSQGVVLLSGKNKVTRENRDMFAFLALALGASCVRRAANLKDTNTLLKQDPDNWKWVFVDGDVAEAAAELFDENALGNADSGKKRKRGQDPARSLAGMFATDGKVTVVNDEFVIQSLILGALAF